MTRQMSGGAGPSTNAKPLASPGVRPGVVRRGIDTVTRALAMLSIACIVLILVATVGDVVRRFAWGKSIQGVTELGEVAMVAIVFLGLAFAQARDAHVAMTIVVRRLPQRAAAIVNALGLATVTVVVGWMLLVTTERAVESYQISEYRFGLVQVPIWPARIAVAVGTGVLVLQLLLSLLDSLRVAARPTEKAAGSDDPTPTDAGRA